MISRSHSADRQGAAATSAGAACASRDVGRPMAFRWLWMSYVVLGLALLAAAKITPSDFRMLDKTLRVSPSASRYDLAYDDSLGAWAAVAAQHEETRFRGGGRSAWGIRLLLQGQALVIEESCPMDVPHVHGVPRETDDGISVAFEARCAATSQSTTIVVGVADRYVSPQGGICTNCWDRFEVRAPLTTEWHSFVIPVNSMRQEGWGRPARREADESSLVDVAASVEGGEQFDVSLRDLRVARAPRGSH